MTALYVVLGLWLVVGVSLTTLILWLIYTSPIKLAYLFKEAGVEQHVIDSFMDARNNWKNDSFLGKILRLMLFTVLSPMVFLALIVVSVSSSLSKMIGK
mgnify:CR=1 FL=1